MTKYYKNFILFAVSYYTIFFFLQLSIRIFSSLYCPTFKHKRNNCKCVALCPLPFPVSLFCWSPLFEKPGMSFAECYLKGRLMFLSILPIYSERAARKYSSLMV